MHATPAALMLELVRLCAWLAILALAFVPLERVFALRDAPKLGRQHTANDLAYYFLSGLAPSLLLIVPTAVLAWAAHRIMPEGYLATVAALPLWVRLPAVLLVGEVGFYWGHRWSHEVPFLWRFHAIHHAPDHVSWLVNTRAHPIDMVFTRLCGLVPLYVLGLAQATGHGAGLLPALTVFVSTVWGFLIHANVRWRFGWLERLVTTPAFHHWHHTNDTHRDHNYAATLPWLDRLFGTHHLPARWPDAYGIDATLPPGFAGQLVQPLTTPGFGLPSPAAPRSSGSAAIA